MMNADAVYLAALCALKGVGRAKILELVRALGSAQAVFAADAATLRATGLLSYEQLSFLSSKHAENLPARIENFCRREGVRLLCLTDDSYPSSLVHTADPPLALYVQGTLPRAEYRLAIVGSRRCSEYGKKAATYFAAKLAACGVPIISGGAKGIDAAAHEGCLDVGGQTAAVMGCSLDIVYPEENAKLFQRILARGGALVSEYPPGTQPYHYNFPARNRIIVGLSQGVVVAEAKRKSGALITANIAADEGRDVYCVPGNIFDGYSVGCHDLIRLGAKLVDNPQDILEDREIWEAVRREKITQPSVFDFAQEEPAEAAEPDVSPLGKKLLEHLRRGACTLEELVEISDTDFASVSMELLELQSGGWVAEDEARRYCRR